jgi:putative Mg2+ transporter-C (MgtC) family protein
MSEWLHSASTWFVSYGGFDALELSSRLLLAMVVGGLLGWERERQDKPAGLRTHMLVAMGSALISVVAMELSSTAGTMHSAVRVDPLRAVAGIIGGIGFLGAGTIIESRGSVQGITTAATIWVVASLGIASGVGLYFLVIVGGVFALATLRIIGRLEMRFFADTHGKQKSSPDAERQDAPSD